MKMPRTNREVKGMNRARTMGNSADFSQRDLNGLFDKLEPFFNGVLVEMKTFGITDKAYYDQCFLEFNAGVKTNIYDALISKFKLRIKAGFDESIKFLKNFPYDENFPKHIKNEIDKFEYAKRAILSLFNSLKLGASQGSMNSIEKIVKENWDTDYLSQLNDMLHLTTELTKIFSTSRRNGNTQTVLPVKTILKYYEDNDNSPANLSGKKLIPEFKRGFINNAREDYKKLQADYMAGGIHMFLKSSLKFITDEDFRLENALIEDISKELKPILIREYVNKAYDLILENYKHIIEKNDDDEFQAIVKLFDRIDKLTPFAKKTEEYFVEKCQKRILEEIQKVADLAKNSTTPVRPLHKDSIASMKIFLEFYDLFAHLRDVSFLKNITFQTQLINGFKTLFQSNALIKQSGEGENFVPKVLTSFIHGFLRKGSKIEIEGKTKQSVISSIAEILQMAGGTDIFIKYYSQHLQERLIEAIIESKDDELFAITTIEKVCDRSEVDKLHKIFTEYDTSTQENERFKYHCQNQRIVLPKMDFTCLIFPMIQTEGNQTIDKFNNFKHYDPCMAIFNAYKNFCVRDGSKKKVDLDIGRSWCVLQIPFNKRKYEIIARYPQTVILMLFNEKKEMTFAELGERTGLGSDILAYQLSGIVSKGVLSCSTGKSFEPESEFKFNMAFKPKVPKINVKQPDKNYLEIEEKAKTDTISDAVLKDRSLKIQAREVRIMKQRRTMKFIDLINETIDSLRKQFNVSSKMARKEIEFLISKEYFKRSEQDINILEYIA